MIKRRENWNKKYKKKDGRENEDIRKRVNC